MKIRSWRRFSYLLKEGGFLTKRTTTLGDHYSFPRRILKCNNSYFPVRYIYFS